MKKRMCQNVTFDTPSMCTGKMYLCRVIFSDFVQRTSHGLEVWREKDKNRGPQNRIWESLKHTAKIGEIYERSKSLLIYLLTMTC